MHRKTKIYKHFMIQPYQANFTKRHIKEYLIALDGFLQMDGKLINKFNWEKFFKEYNNNDAVGFEDLYDILSKWAVSPENDSLDYSDFAAAEERQQIKTGEDFKKMTDKLT